MVPLLGLGLVLVSTWVHERSDRTDSAEAVVYIRLASSEQGYGGETPLSPMTQNDDYDESQLCS